MAIPKDSVKDVFIKMDPRDKTLTNASGKMVVQIWHLLKARCCGEQRLAIRSGPAKGAFHASEEDLSILDRRLLFWQVRFSIVV